MRVVDVTGTRKGRSGRVLLSTIVMSTVLLASSMIPSALAVEEHAIRDVGAIDPITCASWNAELRAHPESVAPDLRAAIKTLKDTGCRATEETVVSQSILPFQPQAVAAATTCKYVYKSYHMYSGPIETYTAHDDAYVCWNGTKAWQQDYHHCYVTAYPLGFGESTWCGRINNNTAKVTLRNDFYVATYALPVYHRFGWMSYTVTKSGVISGVSGFCCS